MAKRAPVSNAMLIGTREWKGKPACVGHDPEIWQKAATERDAKDICEWCPVQPQCLLTAIHRNEQYGVWGGLNVAERTSLKRAVRRKREKGKRIDD